ncbi:MAG TPA: sigma-70 family RNA polymerase sigma factor [Gemmatimonadaceae bacterium]|nr:sigma-70 family RNA polymerase sigma factor [Gemmatimonadaceae bacterium]
MNERELLARHFEQQRAHLHKVAYRMLGSAVEAEDAVQEAWVRVSSAGDDDVDNLRAWMTTIVARVCLDMLRTRHSRREEAIDALQPEPSAGRPNERSIEEDIELADSVELALLVVLETLQPAERVAFVLHDMFDLPFDEIAPIVGRSSAATRQLASRARRRVQGASVSDVDRSRKREVVEAFLTAARAGDFEALVAVLDPAVVLRADAEAVRMGGPAELRGAAAVAEFFKGRASAAVPGLIEGEVGILVPRDGRMLVALQITFSGARIAGIHGVADPETLRALEMSTSISA